MTCELEFSLPEDDKFFDDKVRPAVDYTTRRYQVGNLENYHRMCVCVVVGEGGSLCRPIYLI